MRRVILEISKGNATQSSTYTVSLRYAASLKCAALGHLSLIFGDADWDVR